MRKFKLSTQLIILFSTVTLFSSLVFGLISYRNYQTVYMGLAKNEVSTYIETIKYQPREVDNKSYLGYIDFIVKREGLFKVNLVGQPIYSDNVKEMTNNNEAIMLEILEKGYAGDQFEVHTKDKQTFYVLIRSVSKNPITQEDRYIIGVMDDSYINTLKGTTAQEDVLLTFYGTFVAFAIITLIGNISLVLWSRFVANRVKKIKNEVSHFTSSGYQNELRLEGNDEIKELADAVESLRIEILRNEKTKQEMFQNLSHDLKTPISVISSYAEAIRDGVTDISDAQIIMKQADKLQQKVKMMLDINKLEYIS
ncbi:MAG: histidine kinase dimerization/phospho-acceptor domain-containing protein, partial [Acholeplasmataceae bacterium]